MVPLLVEGGWAVTAVARTAEKAKALARLGARAESVDLFDPAAVERAVEGHDAVCNLATSIPAGNRALLPFAWRQNDRVRTLVSRNLVGAAVRAGAGVYVQESIALMYAPGGGWVDEDSPVSPAPHVRSALTAERNAERFTEAGGRGVVLRFALFYGPDSGHTLDAVGMAKKGWAATFGPPEGYVSSIHTDDAAAAVVAALSVPAGVYNVADDEPVTKREYFAALAEALGVAPPRFLPAFFARLTGSVGETLARSLRVSNRRFREQGGWSPAYPSVREGFPALVRQLESAARARAPSRAAPAGRG